MPTLLTAEELAEYLRVNKRTIYRLLEEGDIPAARIGHQWRFDKGTIEAWLHQLSESNGKKKANILVIDDEEMIIEMFREVLKGTDYRLLSARNASDALRTIQGLYIGMVFLDLKMPGMNGVELFRRIKNTKPNLPVVIMTGYPQGELMNQALAQGPFAVMNKPFTDRDVMEAVSSFLKTGSQISRKEVSEVKSLQINKRRSEDRTGFCAE
ncbi:response regulator [Chloroflexota bacterium]